VHDNKRKQASKRQGSDQLEEAASQEWTKIHHAKNKKTESGIGENLAAAIPAHGCP